MDGIPHFFEALPLALQHVVAMIVGCVTPAIIVAGAAGLPQPDRVLLIQASLIAAAIGTCLQLYPIGRRTGLHFGAGQGFISEPVCQSSSASALPMCQPCSPWPANTA